MYLLQYTDKRYIYMIKCLHYIMDFVSRGTILLKLVHLYVHVHVLYTCTCALSSILDY